MFGVVRIATWNVNSLSARLPAVEKWLERAAPDVLLMQETKLADEQVPELSFRMAGYTVAHHGEGRWNGVAVASRKPITDIVTNFGDGPIRASRSTATDDNDFDPFREARMISVTTGDLRVVSAYAPNGREIGSVFYEGKLAWLDRLNRWLREDCSADLPMVLAGDLNVTPTDDDVWDARAAHGGTHVSEQERAALASLREWGLVDAYRMHQPAADRYTWWDYRAGMFHKNMGMRLDLVYVTQTVADRVVWAEIDREARKGTPTPSDHAPVVVDLDERGVAFDAGWQAALERIARRKR